MERKPRVSLTKTQRAAGIGAELLALCQSITADGKLSGEETKELIRWVRENQNSDLPAIGFLVETVRRITEDRVVTPDERRELLLALEKILPPEARRAASERRREREAAKRGQAKAQRLAEQQAKREERERNKLLDSANFMVAGVHYEGRDRIVQQYVTEGDTVFLVRDYTNAYSENAIQVQLRNGLQLGFAPEDFACDLAPLLDDGARHTAYITKILHGGRVPIPVVQSRFYGKDATVDGALMQSEIPQRQETPTSVQLRVDNRRETPNGVMATIKRFFGF